MILDSPFIACEHLGDNGGRVGNILDSCNGESGKKTTVCRNTCEISFVTSICDPCFPFVACLVLAGQYGGAVGDIVRSCNGMSGKFDPMAISVCFRLAPKKSGSSSAFSYGFLSL